jgi:hypothetical protein
MLVTGLLTLTTLSLAVAKLDVIEPAGDTWCMFMRPISCRAGMCADDDA